LFDVGSADGRGRLPTASRERTAAQAAPYIYNTELIDRRFFADFKILKNFTESIDKSSKKRYYIYKKIELKRTIPLLLALRFWTTVTSE